MSEVFFLCLQMVSAHKGEYFNSWNAGAEKGRNLNFYKKKEKSEYCIAERYEFPEYGRYLRETAA